MELKKCIQQIQNNEKKKPKSILEQWGTFLATPQDNTKPLDPALAENMDIKEVYDMLQTFTEQDHLREKYRVQEEFIRTQKTYQAEYETAIRLRDEAIKETEKERKKKEEEQKEKEKERKEKKKKPP